jgi:DNA-binding transcriptional LysR family regulator
MNRLEDELGVKLFDRLSTPIHLTAAGAYFVKQARIILSQKEQMERGLQQFSEQYHGKIRVGMGPGRAEYWAPFILSRFWKLYPDIQVEIITDSMLELEKKLTGWISQEFQRELQLSKFHTMQLKLVERELHMTAYMELQIHREQVWW